MSNANDRQVGGAHYRKHPDRPQHWDVVARNRIGYLEGCATKYVDRWREKGGLVDLRKAEHFVQKIIDLVETTNYRPSGVVPSKELYQFNLGRDKVEAGIITLLLSWSDIVHLKEARRDLFELIDAEDRAGDQV